MLDPDIAFFFVEHPERHHRIRKARYRGEFPGTPDANYVLCVRHANGVLVVPVAATIPEELERALRDSPHPEALAATFWEVMRSYPWDNPAEALERLLQRGMLSS
jgi:hypothetical protein